MVEDVFGMPFYLEVFTERDLGVVVAIFNHARLQALLGHPCHLCKPLESTAFCNAEDENNSIALFPRVHNFARRSKSRSPDIV